ncbi:S41 family peptidase [soil metagenome]
MTRSIHRIPALAPGAVLALLLSLGAFSGSAVAQSPGASPSPAVAVEVCAEPEASAPPRPDETLSIPQEFRIQLFEGVWGGIRDFYVDPEVKGLDWEAIGDEYAPLIVRTDNAYEVYDLLREMVATLDDPYTYFLSPEDQGDPASFDPSYGGIGALLDSSAAGVETDGLRILYVFEGGSAREAGIRERDRIVAVNGDPCARIADIRGPAGTDVTLTIVSPGEEPRDVVVERRQISPLILPEARRLSAAPDVGYLRIPSLAGQEVIDGVAAALAELVEADDPLEGLVIDVRATNQGAPGVIVQVLSHFVAGEVGAFHSRVGDEPITIEPSALAPAYADVPVVVMVDSGSQAEAEQLAAILQDQGRATIVGEETAGETHGSNTVDFPDGSVLQLVSFGFKLPDGETLEGRGVTPDLVIEEDWLAYPEEEDPGLLAAVDAIRSGDASSDGATVASAAPSPIASGDAAG